MVFLKGDYKIGDQSGVYFLTFTVVEWVEVFTRIEYAEIFLNCLNYCVANKGLIVYSWVLMPNHFHGVMRAREGAKLSDIVRDLKKYSAVKILEAIQNHRQESRKNWMLWLFKSAAMKRSSNRHFQFWQHGSHPFELYSTKMIDQKISYIQSNPVRAGFVNEIHEYRYSSAIDYMGGKGLVKVELA